MPIETYTWEPANYINSPAEYLQAALESVQETGDLRIFHQALQDIASTKLIAPDTRNS